MARAIGIDVYDVGELKKKWTPDDCDGRFKNWDEFRASTMFPYNGSSLGAVDFTLIFDNDVETVVVLINDHTD